MKEEDKFYCQSCGKETAREAFKEVIKDFVSNLMFKTFGQDVTGVEYKLKLRVCKVCYDKNVFRPRH